MLHSFFNGKIDEAIDMQLSSIPLIDALFSEVNPIPVKAALNIMGYNFGKPRLPLVELSNDCKIKLEKAMKNYGII